MSEMVCSSCGDFDAEIHMEWREVVEYIGINRWKDDEHTR